MKNFWTTVEVGTADECWPTKRKTSEKHPYGRMWREGRVEYQHRYAFYLTEGVWPEVCRHTCDNPKCCNPLHLVDGDKADNFYDIIDRQTFTSAKLSVSDVVEIKKLLAAGMSDGDVASQYGVHKTTINRIGLNQTWKRVN